MDKHPNIDYRHLLALDAKSTQNFDQLNFDYSHTETLFEKGKNDAKAILSEQKGARFARFKQNYD